MQYKMEQNIFIILLFAGLACYFFLEPDNRLARNLASVKGYDGKKVSYLVGTYMMGIALACVPPLLSAIFQNLWLNWISVGILAGFTVGAYRYEASGGLNKKQ